jgi:hypothetical protein
MGTPERGAVSAIRESRPARGNWVEYEEPALAATVTDPVPRGVAQALKTVRSGARIAGMRTAAFEIRFAFMVSLHAVVKVS